MPSKDPEVLRRATLKWRQNHPDKVQAQQKRRSERYQALSEEEKEVLRRKKREYERARVAKDPEKAAADKQAYYQENKETISAKQKVKLANRTPEEHEAARQYHAQYFQKNREVLTQKNQDYMKTHPEAAKRWTEKSRRKHAVKIALRGKAWKKANPEKLRVQDANRRARKRSTPDTWTADQQAFMESYWHNACAVCGNPKGLFWTLAHDHWIPLNSPTCPGTIATNMIPLCHGTGGCN